MADAPGPTTSELAWRLEQLLGSVQNLIGRAEYTADARGTNQRFDSTRDEIHQVRRELMDLFQALDGRVRHLEELEETTQASKRSAKIAAIAAVVGAVATVIASAVWQAILSHGGHP